MEHLSIKEISERLANIPGWEMHDNCIEKIFSFDNFKQAMEFVNNVAEEAERNRHHPDITINYNKVTLSLTTHDAKGVTHDDFKLARIIEQLI